MEIYPLNMVHDSSSGMMHNNTTWNTLFIQHLHADKKETIGQTDHDGDLIIP